VPVGIPSLKPTHPGGGAPLTPLERQRLARQRAGEKVAVSEAIAPAAARTPAAAPAPVDTYVVRLLSSRGKRPPTTRHLEARWTECLLYPLRAWRLCLGLACIMAVLSACVAMFLPRMLVAEPEQLRTLLLLRLCCLVLVVLIVGLPCSFLERVLASAVDGEVSYICWSGRPVLTFLVSVARWLSCFLAGPGVFAVVGYLYWLNGGEMGTVDRLILAELGAVAGAYLLFALLSLTDRGWLRGLNPLAVVDLAHRMGYRALAVALAAGLVGLAHGWALLAGVATLHEELLLGLVLLAGGWASGVFWGTFFCRLLGIWCHRARLAPAEDEAGAEPAG
jgi:hypothetical protein